MSIVISFLKSLAVIVLICITVTVLQNNSYIAASAFVLVGLKFTNQYFKVQSLTQISIVAVMHCITAFICYHIIYLWKWVLFEFFGATSPLQALGYLLLSSLIVTVLLLAIILAANKLKKAKSLQEN